jgi:hypothetical protein
MQVSGCDGKHGASLARPWNGEVGGVDRRERVGYALALVLAQCSFSRPAEGFERRVHRSKVELASRLETFCGFASALEAATAL